MKWPIRRGHQSVQATGDRRARRAQTRDDEWKNTTIKFTPDLLASHDDRDSIGLRRFSGRRTLSWSNQKTASPSDLSVLVVLLTLPLAHLNSRVIAKSVYSFVRTRQTFATVIAANVVGLLLYSLGLAVCFFAPLGENLPFLDCCSILAC